MGGEQKQSENTGGREYESDAMLRAFQRHEAEIRAVELPRSRRARVNVDVVRLAGYVIAVAGRVGDHLDEIEQAAPRLAFGPDTLADLTSVARATMWAAIEASTTFQVRRPVGPLVAEARVWRHKLEPALRLKIALKTGRSTRIVPKLVGRAPAHWGVLLQSLAIGLRDEGLEGTPFTEDDLEAAERLVPDLLRASRRRGDVSIEVEKARELRAKAFALMRLRYDEMRAAVLYALRGRRQTSLRAIVPTLWSGRGARVGRRKKPVPA